MAEEKPGEIRQGGGGKKVAADVADHPKADRHMIPVWFFAGILLFIYGILIFVTGLSEWSNPPDTVLASLHAPVWWGAIMIAMGGIFIQLFRPKKSAK